MRVKRTKEMISEAVKNNYSQAGVLSALGLRPAGGNYKWLKKVIRDYNLDISHFTGAAWSRGKKLDYSNRQIPIEEILVENSNWSSSNHLRKRLIKEGLKSHVCEMCSLEEWNGNPIPLELDHINGNNTDNRIQNLRLLCPNCHAGTPFYRGKNKLSSLNERRELNRVKFGEPLTGNPEPSLNNQEGVET